VHITFVSFTH